MITWQRKNKFAEIAGDSQQKKFVLYANLQTSQQAGRG